MLFLMNKYNFWLLPFELGICDMKAEGQLQLFWKVAGDDCSEQGDHYNKTTNLDWPATSGISLARWPPNLSHHIIMSGEEEH